MRDRKDGLPKGAVVAYSTRAMAMLLALVLLQLGLHGHIFIRVSSVASSVLLVFTVSIAVGTGLTIVERYSFTSVHRPLHRLTTLMTV